MFGIDQPIKTCRRCGRTAHAMTMICRDCSEMLNDAKTEPLRSFLPKPVHKDRASALELAKFAGVIGALVIVSCFTGYFFLHILVVGPIFFLPMKRNSVTTHASAE